MTTPADPADVAAARLRRAPPGEARRRIIAGLAACLFERVEPRPPALDSWAREKWELARRAELLRQIAVLRALRP
jgi:hypothetical protein